MPAASDPRRVGAVELPRTWRPLGVRIAVFVFGGMLLVLCAVVWLAFGPEIRSHFTYLQRGTVVFLGMLLFGCWWGLARCRVTATPAGLTVVNGFRSRHFDWAQIVAVSLPPGAPWATLDIADGTTLSVFGIQGSDGTRAKTAVRELRAAISAQTPAP